MGIPTNPTATTRLGGPATLRDHYFHWLLEVGAVTICFPLDAWREVEELVDDRRGDPGADPIGFNPVGGDRKAR